MMFRIAERKAVGRDGHAVIMRSKSGSILSGGFDAVSNAAMGVDDVCKLLYLLVVTSPDS